MDPQELKQAFCVLADIRDKGIFHDEISEQADADTYYVDIDGVRYYYQAEDEFTNRFFCDVVSVHENTFRGVYYTKGSEAEFAAVWSKIKEFFKK